MTALACRFVDEAGALPEFDALARGRIRMPRSGGKPGDGEHRVAEEFIKDRDGGHGHLASSFQGRAAFFVKCQQGLGICQRTPGLGADAVQEVFQPAAAVAFLADREETPIVSVAVFLKKPER